MKPYNVSDNDSETRRTARYRSQTKDDRTGHELMESGQLWSRIGYKECRETQTIPEEEKKGSCVGRTEPLEAQKKRRKDQGEN
jgi:hypothetical protein